MANPTKDTNNKDWDWVVVYPSFVANCCLFFCTSNNFKLMVDSTKGITMLILRGKFKHLRLRGIQGCFS
jgi:hypothetical protein